jgi:hypothetical protein
MQQNLKNEFKLIQQETTCTFKKTSKNVKEPSWHVINFVPLFSNTN